MRILFERKHNKRNLTYSAGKRVRSSGRTRLPQERLRTRSLFDWLGAFGADDIAVDLGTANTVLYIRGRGIAVREPSVLAIDKHTREVLAVGSAAALMTGRTPDGIELVWPITNGAVTDYEGAAHLVQALIDEQIKGMRARPRVIVTTGTGLNSVERRAALETAAQMGARKVVGMEGPLAAAYAADLEKARTAGLLVIDIGAGTTDMAILNAHGIVRAVMHRSGSMAWDRAIIRKLAQVHGVRIGPITAEMLKHRLADMSEDAEGGYECTGKSDVTGLPETFMADVQDLRAALRPYADLIAATAEEMLSRTMPELAEWIRTNGIMLTGGGALLRGLDRYLTSRLGTPVYVAENPFYSVVIGAGKALSEMDLLRDSLGEQR